MSSETILRAQARAAIETGSIPDRHPDRLWGGRASRSHCVACRSPLKAGEVVLEIQYVNGGGTLTHDVHIRCYVALEDEWNLRNAAAAGQQHPTNTVSNWIHPEGGL